MITLLQRLLCVLLALCMCAATASPIAVSVKIDGIEDQALQEELRSLLSVTSKETSFTATAPLRRAAQKDADILRLALLSKGYYAAQITPQIIRDNDTARITFGISSGEKFNITRYEINYQDETENPRPASLDDFGITTDGAPDGDRLASIDAQITSYLRNNGYPASMSLGRIVEADFSNATGNAVFSYTTGPKAVYGTIKVIGAVKTRTNHLRALRPFEDGALYRQSEIAAYEKAVMKTGLFTQTSIAPGKVGTDGVTDILITVQERKRRSVGAGVTFASDIGAGVTMFWENRNFRGGGDSILARVALAAPLQELQVTYNKPVPRLPGSWGLDALVRNENTDAFTAQTGKLGVGIIQRLFNEQLELNAKLQYTVSDITDSDGTKDTFSSASFPLAARFNNENDPLNPTTGHRVNLSVTPYFGSTSFTKTQLGGATRVRLGKDKRLTLAMQALFGASYGLDGNILPATERYYAGGGGSVRGYGFQLAGPLDNNGDPLGGTSLATINTEARFAVTEEIQIATFVDAGSVFESSFPSFDQDIPIGAGFGVRYLTPIGPLRLDIAVPVNKRKLTRVVDGAVETSFEDAPLHVYIALGQPF